MPPKLCPHPASLWLLQTQSPGFCNSEGLAVNLLQGLGL